MRAVLYSILISISFLSFSGANSNDNIIHQSIAKIKSLERYYYISNSSIGGVNRQKYKTIIKAISNPSDSIMGSKFIVYDNDTSNLITNYHNDISCRYINETKKVEIQKQKQGEPYPIIAPVPVKALSLLNYYLVNKDSVSLEAFQHGSNSELVFTFINKDICFVNLVPAIHKKTGIVSKIILWLNKDLLPYKIDHHLPSTDWIEEIQYLAPSFTRMDYEKIETNYIPEGFSIAANSQKDLKESWNEFLNTRVINIDLEKIDGTKINLAKLDCPTLLEFTATSCGPCNRAISFLNSYSKRGKQRV